LYSGTGGITNISAALSGVSKVEVHNAYGTRDSKHHGYMRNNLSTIKCSTERHLLIDLTKIGEDGVDMPELILHRWRSVVHTMALSNSDRNKVVVIAIRVQNQHKSLAFLNEVRMYSTSTTVTASYSPLHRDMVLFIKACIVDGYPGDALEERYEGLRSGSLLKMDECFAVSKEASSGLSNLAMEVFNYILFWKKSPRDMVRKYRAAATTVQRLMDSKGSIDNSNMQNDEESWFRYLDRIGIEWMTLTPMEEKIKAERTSSMGNPFPKSQIRMLEDYLRVKGMNMDHRMKTFERDYFRKGYVFSGSSSIEEYSRFSTYCEQTLEVIEGFLIDRIEFLVLIVVNEAKQEGRKRLNTCAEKFILDATKVVGNIVEMLFNLSYVKVSGKGIIVSNGFSITRSSLIEATVNYRFLRTPGRVVAKFEHLVFRIARSSFKILKK
jgi:hypothetical protein